MLNKKGSILIAAIGTIFCFLSIVYVSCTKVGGRPACNGVICQNGGFCSKGHCVCPSGYEGTNCGTSSASRFIGSEDAKAWNVYQTVTGSDTASAIGADSSYTVFFKKTATPTTFFIDNFLGNPSYNDILCTMDTLNTRSFTLDSLRDLNMWYEHLFIRNGSSGLMEGNDTAINATIILRYVNKTHNWQVDTLTMRFTPHRF